MTDYTPGPWEFEPEGKACGPYVTDGNGRTICDLYFLTPAFGTVVVHSATEARSNAHLIAAAPELLEALEGMCDMASHSEMEYSERRRIMRAARLAIQKAKGA